MFFLSIDPTLINDRIVRSLVELFISCDNIQIAGQRYFHLRKMGSNTTSLIDPVHTMIERSKQTRSSPFFEQKTVTRSILGSLII